MHALAVWFARRTWWGLLWLMRQRWMQRAQLWPARMMRDEGRRATFIRRHNGQNRFARRIGLPLLTIAFEALLASAILSVMYHAALALIDGGYIVPPSLQDRRAPGEG